MKTPRHAISRNAQGPQRSFTWELRSTDIPFMAVDRLAPGADGCLSNCNDCGCGIIGFDAPRARTAQGEQP